MRRAGAAVVLAALVAIALPPSFVSLQQDFAAYRTAGAAQRAGLDPYLNHVGSSQAPGLWDGVALFRHSRFLYPPLVADVFRPLAALPYRAAKILFTAAMLAAFVAAACLVEEPLAVLAGGVLFFPLWRHLERGQIDLLLLLLLAVAWRLRARPLAGGAALAAAVAIKPALAGVVLVVAALGRPRVATAALGGIAAVAALTVVVDGAPRLHEYLTEVAPRAALYGEGGTEAMLLGDEHFADGDGQLTRVEGRAYTTALWDLPAAASLPRLLAPDSPTRASATLPFLFVFAALMAAARRCHNSGGDPTWLFWGAAVASVVTSPAGWVMGLVFGLPLLPRLVAALAGRTWPVGLAVAAALSWIAIAAPWPVAGVAAIGGAGLVAVAALAATRPPAGGTA